MLFEASVNTLSCNVKLSKTSIIMQKYVFMIVKKCVFVTGNSKLNNCQMTVCYYGYSDLSSLRIVSYGTVDHRPRTISKVFRSVHGFNPNHILF